MRPAEWKADEARDVSTKVRMGVGSWTILIVLLSLLAATLVVVYFGWTYGNDADVPSSGYVAMAIGVIISLVVGFGLMALVFYSSRKGFEELPALIVPADTIKTSGQSSKSPEQ